MSEPAAPRRGRALAGWIALVLAAVLLLLASFAVWVDRVALNTDGFVDASTELIEDDAIRKAVSARAVDELFASVDVDAEIKEQLPKDYKSLSGPAAAGIREASYTLAARALEQPRLQRLWAITLEETHERLVEVLEGEGGTVTTEGGVVTLDLERIVLEAADRVGIRAQVEDELPPDVGSIEILRSDELDTAQDGFQILQALAWVLPVLTLIAFGIVVWLADDRRRAIRRIGVALVAIGIVGLMAVNLVGNYLVDELVTETDTQTAAGNAWDVLTEQLRGSYRTLAGIGVLVLVAAWVAGPSKRAAGMRRFLAPAVRERAWAYAGLAAVTVLLLVAGWVTDFTRFLLLLVLVALGAAWIEVTRRQTRAEFPQASGSASLADARAKLASWWEVALDRASRVRPAAAAPAGGSDLVSTLATLSDLHARGALTDEEFATAKTRVLG